MIREPGTTAAAPGAAAATGAILELADVEIRYSAAAYALHIDRLTVRPGEVLGVIGPNGSGKSTLLRVLALLERPHTGRVLFRGRAVEPGDALASRRRMAVVFQEPLLADMSVADNVALGLRFRRLAAPERRARVARWLERLAIAELAGRRPHTLSGGQAQRVALARALVLEPEVLLLDEPFSSLDQPSRAALVPDVGAILRADRVTTVLVTHDRGEAQALGDRVAVLIDGRVQQLDDTAAVFRAPASEVVARFVGVETIVDGRVGAREGDVAVVDVDGRAVRVASAEPVGRAVRLAIRPEDVVLALPDERPARSSARNVLPGKVVDLAVGPHGVRVVVDCGFPLVTLVTARALDELRLRPGAGVDAVFKASAVHVLPL